ncbi:hypothetical protein LXA43DRAFT_974402 [Ganoderma leucocontextum]|nr:hypothetical protein LXA43DRAFT_974402 [Ganoderma leucocontextum]
MTPTYCAVYTTTGTTTPQPPSHAAHTPLRFFAGSPHDHAAYIQQGPSLVPSAPSQSGYLYPHSSLPAVPLCPVPPPTYRMGPQHKTQLATTTWPATTTETSPTMAITIPHNDRLAPTATASTSGRPSRSTRDGYGSDQGGERTPPSGGSHPPKDSKKKIHPCWMCHKSFDRPSTLKKHLLVHTGEKAFACESCGRRFGVASNLNRHAKTCRVAHAATTGSGSSAAGNPSRDAGSASPSHSQAVSGTSPAPASSPEANTGTPAPADVGTSSSVVQRRPARKRKGTDEETPSPDSAPAAANSAAPEARPRSRKRARRAPSPALWVPESLRTFDLTPITKGTPVPLPPVRPFQDSQNLEERDSFDENAAMTPYHPHGWKGRLPGPGLLGNNVANRSGGHILIF